LLEPVRAGEEVIVESNGVLIAVVKAPERQGQPPSKMTELARDLSKEREARRATLNTIACHS
jgi:antitoxin (DNA-binding transcriptional repressor) of toxin-antitoxin stability system